MSAPVRVDLVIETEAWTRAIGDDLEDFTRTVVLAAAAAEQAGGAVCVLLTDDSEMAALNAAWRGLNKPTNVLSFPAGAGADGLLGDVALGLETVLAEAAAQEKTARAHAAHLLTHGFLHLLGYDHEAEEEAEAMETRERRILASLGFADPYADPCAEPVDGGRDTL